MELMIDSATAACSVALIDGERLIDAHFELIGRGHAERLLPMIATLLGTRRPASILVDCGPGSFTGTRVGLAAAHGLAIGWRVPLHGYTSLALIAAGAGGDVGVALEGGHGQLFVQSYDADLAPLDELRALAPDDAARLIAMPRIVGSGAARLIEARGFGEAAEAHPRAADARLLPLRLRSLAPRPIYGRAPDAKPVLSDAAGGVEGPFH